jgi:integrase
MPRKQRGRGEGSIFMRKEGLWVAEISLDDGRRKTLYAKTKAEAAERLRHVQREIDEGRFVYDDSQTVGQYLRNWLVTKQIEMRPSAFRRVEEHVRLRLIPALGQTRLTKLTPQQIQTVYAECLTQELASSTVRGMHFTLRNALETAIEQGSLSRNPAQAVKKPRQMRHEMQVLNAEQARALIEAARGERLEALYLLALHTGMRQGELLGLRWKDVHLDLNSLHITTTVSWDATGYHFGEPKTKRSRRRIALSPAIVGALHAHRTRQGEERLQVGAAWQDHGLVFPTLLGTPQSPSNIRTRSMKRILTRAHLPLVRFHDLRHTAATLALSANVNPKIVSEMLGHSSVAFTLDTYSHVLPTMQTDAAAVMDHVLAARASS